MKRKSRPIKDKGVRGGKRRVLGKRRTDKWEIKLQKK
jgi:hypothetical protein